MLLTRLNSLPLCCGSTDMMELPCADESTKHDAVSSICTGTEVPLHHQVKNWSLSVTSLRKRMGNQQESTALPSRCDCPHGLLFQTFSTRWWKTASAPSIPLGSWTVRAPKQQYSTYKLNTINFCWCKSSWFPGNQCIYSLNLSRYEHLFTINIFVLSSLHCMGNCYTNICVAPIHHQPASASGWACLKPGMLS